MVAKRRSNIALYADELGKGFVGELDYTLEASNASIFLVSNITSRVVCLLLDSIT
jgi:predicted unusual protein kinase regulating ubiquinone biosynthesis (AarF/ABC1/UbiB family)